MPEIQYPKNPNSDTAFVVQEDGTKNRALMTAPQDTSSLELPTNSNSAKGYVTIDGKKQRVILTADISGGGSSLPDQTGQSGKFLTTDGTDASWSDKPLVNNINSEYSLGLLKSATASSNGVAIGWSANSVGGVSIGQTTKSSNGVAIGTLAKAKANYSIALGQSAQVGNAATGAIQFNTAGGTTYTNSDANTFKVANANGNFEIMSADGTIPEARLADTTNAAQGQVLTLDSNLNAVWQAGGGGASYTAGTGIDITNNAISVQMPVHYNENGAYAIGIATQEPGISDYYSVAIGTMASAGSYGVNIGGDGPVPQGTISIGWFESTPSEQGVVLFHTMDSNSNYHTYKMLEADGTVPADRLASTTGLADGNYRLRLVMASGVPTLEWVAE